MITILTFKLHRSQTIVKCLVLHISPIHSSNLIDREQMESFLNRELSIPFKSQISLHLSVIKMREYRKRAHPNGNIDHKAPRMVFLRLPILPNKEEDQKSIFLTHCASPKLSVINRNWSNNQTQCATLHSSLKLTTCLSFSKSSPLRHGQCQWSNEEFTSTFPQTDPLIHRSFRNDTLRSIMQQDMTQRRNNLTLEQSQSTEWRRICAVGSWRRSHLCHLFATVCIAALLLLAATSSVLAMPQTSAMSYHTAPPRQQPYPPSQTYQHHSYHDKYHLFSSQQVQPKPKSSSLFRLDSNQQNQQPLNISQTGNNVNTSCPNCGRHFDLQEAKNLKLEAIQQQILSKLNLIEKPKINRDWLNREQALEAIRKAKLNAKVRSYSRPAAIGSNGSRRHKRKRHSRRESDTPQHRRLSFSESVRKNNTFDASVNPDGDQFEDFFGHLKEEDADEEEEESNDEYYGKTSEIIAFAEPGKKHLLLLISVCFLLISSLLKPPD